MKCCSGCSVTAIAEPAILDMGCGLSATLRSIAGQCPQAHLTGITLVPWQQEKGTELNSSGPDSTAITQRIQILLGNYEATGLRAASFDAIYALESSCYAHGEDKAALLTEAYRLLRPGGRLVVADGMMNRPNGLIGPQKAICRELCKCWVIDTLGEIHAFGRSA